MIKISEFRPNPTGSDPATQTIELSGGTPGSSFTGVILSIEADNGSQAINDLEAISGTFDANGILTVDIDDLENPSFTLVLAEGYTGAASAAFNQAELVNVLDAIGIPDAAGDEANLLGAQLGGADFKYTGDEPQLIFRTADGNLFAVNDPAGDEVVDVNGTAFPATDFTPDPTVATFGVANPECFLTGTLLQTSKGERPVESLNIGDLIKTADGTLVPIKWIGIQTFSTQDAHPFRAFPVQIKAGALGNGLPVRDLFVTPDHALLVDGILANAGALTNNLSIVQMKPEVTTFTYYHIELEHHALLLAEGVPAESFIPQALEGRDKFDNVDEFSELHPEGGALVHMPMSYPRVNSKRQLPQSVAKRLLQVAQTLPNVQEMALLA